MKQLLFCITFLFFAVYGQAQFRLAVNGTPSWTNLGGGLYSATVTFHADLTGNSYAVAGIVDTMRLFTGRGQVFEVDSVWGKTFSQATLRVEYLEGVSSAPVGQSMVYNPNNSVFIPDVPFGSTGATAQLNQAVVSYNASKSIRPPFDSTDITTGGVGNTDLAAGIVTTGKIADDAVTLAKQAAGTANRLIGFDGSGNPSEISAGANVTISGGSISTPSVVVTDSLDDLPAAAAFKAADRVVLTDSTGTFQKLIEQTRDSLQVDSIFTDVNVASSTITAITKNRKDVSIFLALTDSVTFDRSVSLPATNTNAKRFTFYANYDTTGLADYSYYLSGEMFFRGQRITKYYLDKGEMVIAEFRDSLYFLETDFEPNFAGRQAIKEGRTVPGITIVDERGHKWETSTYPKYGHIKVADGIIQYTSKPKIQAGQNIFTHLDRIGTDATPWLWLSPDPTFISNDTLHPVSGDYSADRFTLTSTSGGILYTPTALDGYYESDSTYTVTFWARKGADAASSNLSLSFIFQYSGSPDPTFVIPLTTEWKRFNIVVTALSSSRTFTGVQFRMTGDAGDYLFMTDFNLRKGAYYYPFYAETRDSVFTGEKIYVNAEFENSTLNFEQFRGTKENDRKTLQYVMDECQDIEGCNRVFVQENITIDSTVALKEGVVLQGGFTGTGLSGSGNYLLQGTRIITTLADSTKVAFQATGTSQIAGIGIKNFIINTTRPLKAVIATGDALNMDIENITINVGDEGLPDSLLYGILFESGSLKAQIKDVSASARDYGFYGVSSVATLQNCKSLGSKYGFYATGGIWDLESCWFEDNLIGAIYFNSIAGRLTINDLYIENSPTTGTEPVLKIMAAENVTVNGGILSTRSGAPDELRTVFLDTVGVANFIGVAFANQGQYVFKNTSMSGSLTAIGNNHSSTLTQLLPLDWTDIVDSSRVVSLNNVRRNVSSTVTYDRNWIGKLVATGYNFYDGYIIEQDKRLELNGDQNVRGDTINLIGTQNLVTYSEQLDNTSGWDQTGAGTINITPNDTTNVDGQMKADLLVYVSGTQAMRSLGMTGIKNSTPYTVRYDVRKPYHANTVTIQPQFNISGTGDVFGDIDTVTTSWQTIVQTVVTPETGSISFDLAFTGDSIWITKVSVTEGHFNGVYTETTTAPLTSKEVVFDGDLQLNGAFVDSSGSPGTAGQVPISTVTGWHWGPVIQSSDFTATVTQSGSDTLQNSAQCYGYFQRVGNYVTFTVRIEVALTATGNANTVYFDPPIASNFTTAASDVIGVAGLDAQGLSSADVKKQRCLLFASDSDDKIGISFDPVASLAYPENRVYISASGSYIIQ